MRCCGRGILLALAVFGSAFPLGVAHAQQQDRPRLVLNTQGPGGATFAVGFSPDSQRIYAAGVDKVAHVWTLHGEPGRNERAALVNTLRWEIARGYRGVIHAMAPSPTTEQVAVAGSSARDPGGDIVLFDAAGGTIERVLHGHAVTVISLAWSTDGKQLVSVDTGGEIRVWSAPNWRSMQLHPPGGPGETPETYRPAMFLGDRIVAAAQRREGPPQQWQIVLYDTARGGAKWRTLEETHQDHITALARTPAGG
ncbi:MAG: WD40 repeat domain-containing protein, partial [Planctomycetaceae bacterium]